MLYLKILLLLLISTFSFSVKGSEGIKSQNAIIYVKSFEELLVLSKKPSPVYVNLLPGSYEFTETIKLPDGSIISGDSKTTLYARKNINAFFDVSGSTNISIRNLIFELENLNKGIIGREAYPSKNITISNNNFIGNLRFVDIEEEESSKAIFIKNGVGINIFDNVLRDTFGGIYAIGNKVKIKGNSLLRVNFGNIVASGSDIQIVDNFVRESGKGSRFHHPSGDTITLGGGSENVVIKNNRFDTGYCYILWAHAPQKNIKVLDNVVKNGVTTGFMIEGAVNAVIDNNTFDSNLANGLAFVKGGSNISILNNKFVANPLLVSSDYKDVVVMNNSFSHTETPLNIPKTFQLFNNNIQPLVIAEKERVSLEILRTDTGETVNSLDILRGESRSKIDFTIRNPTKKVIKFYGFPQVIITKGHPLENGSRGPRVSGDSGAGGISVPSRYQPTTLSLKPGEEADFSVLFSKKESLLLGDYYINIPNSADHPTTYSISLKIVDLEG